MWCEAGATTNQMQSLSILMVSADTPLTHSGVLDIGFNTSPNCDSMSILMNSDRADHGFVWAANYDFLL